VAMQGGHDDPTSGQGKIPVNTASHAGSKVTQPHHTEVHLATYHKHGTFQQTWQLMTQEKFVCATC